MEATTAPHFWRESWWKKEDQSMTKEVLLPPREEQACRQSWKQQKKHVLDVVIPGKKLGSSHLNPADHLNTHLAYKEAQISA